MRVWRRQLFLVRFRDGRRYGPQRRATRLGDAFVALNLGRYRLGWWYRTTRDW